jgi:hypothetical protein
MKMTQRKQLQTAYLQPDLLPADDFVSYCKENGVETDEQELEYFDKQNLLIPAVRVSVGYLEMRDVLLDINGRDEWRQVYADQLDQHNYKKLGPKKHYIRGALIRSAPGLGEIRAFHYGNDGWLDWYTEHEMVSFPAIEGYLPWDKFRGGHAMTANRKSFEHVGYLMYAKHQIYPLKDVQQGRQITVKNEALYRSKETWAEQGTKITDIFTNGITDERIRNLTIDYNKFFLLLTEIRKLRIAKNSRVAERYWLAKNIQGEKEALEEAREEADFIDGEHKSKAKQLLQDHGFTLEELQNWRFKLLMRGSFDISGDNKKLRAYVARLDDSLLNETEDIYLLVNIMSWFIDLLGGDGITAKQLLLREMKPHCSICGKGFDPTRHTQVTCGSPSCKQAHQLKYKKQMRHSGKYSS